jgi:hypothetical protein
MSSVSSDGTRLSTERERPDKHPKSRVVRAGGGPDTKRSPVAGLCVSVNVCCKVPQDLCDGCPSSDGTRLSPHTQRPTTSPKSRESRTGGEVDPENHTGRWVFCGHKRVFQSTFRNSVTVAPLHLDSVPASPHTEKVQTSTLCCVSH